MPLFFFRTKSKSVDRAIMPVVSPISDLFATLARNWGVEVEFADSRNVFGRCAQSTVEELGLSCYCPAATGRSPDRQAIPQAIPQAILQPIVLESNTPGDRRSQSLKQSRIAIAADQFVRRDLTTVKSQHCQRCIYNRPLGI